MNYQQSGIRFYIRKGLKYNSPEIKQIINKYDALLLFSLIQHESTTMYKKIIAEIVVNSRIVARFNFLVA